MGFYTGLILVWAMPVLALQWAFGADALMAQKRVWRGPLLSVWIYLCIVDRWAIRNGIWSLNPELTLPLIFDMLPVEEALFFLVSATMCLWGLVLAMTVTRLDGPFMQSMWKVMLWSNKCRAQPKPTSLLTWATENPRPMILTVAALVSVKSMSNMPLTVQMLCLGLASILFGVQSLAQVALSDYFQKPEIPDQLIGVSVNEQLKEMIKPDALGNFGNFGKASKIQLILMGVLIGQYYTFLWNQNPSLAFNIFVCIMIYRFGKADCSRDPAARLPVVDVFARGGLLLFAARWHPSSFAECFSYLIGGQHALVVSSMAFLKFLGSMHLVALILSLVYHGLKCHEGRHVAIIYEMCTLILAFWFLPPATSIVLYMAVFYFSMNMEWLSGLAFTKEKEQASENQNLSLKLTVAMALSCMLAIVFDVHAGHHLHHSLHSKHKIVNCCFIWLSSATMLHIVYRADYRSWLSDKILHSQ
jgi:lycopene cyclase domain-containing protein